MRGRSISIGAVVLASLLYVLFFPDGLINVLFFRETPVFRGPWVEYALVFLVAPGGICLEIVDFIRRRQTIEKDSSLEPIRERIVTERVLVVCPYCRAKNEQGILKCRACGAEI